MESGQALVRKTSSHFPESLDSSQCAGTGVHLRDGLHTHSTRECF